MTDSLLNWWKFSRPHTIIGSLLSITGLFIISCAESSALHQSDTWTLVDDFSHVYIITLVSALACNVFIVGLNQWQDIEVDRINKPWLPLAAGTISLKQGKIAVWTALIISLATAALLGSSFLALMLLINGIGAAYSLPPLKLKRHHLPAAIAIVSVRGLLVNLGMTAHFLQQLEGGWRVPLGVWPLALFIVGFSFGIAWFKDIPDTAGDAQFSFKTLAVSMSRKTALWLGVAVVSLSYLLVSASPFVIEMPVQKAVFALSHLGLSLLFIYKASLLNLADAKAIKHFYLFFWALFFLEYLIYPISYLLA
jgi:homogentisate phytyltransferase/homogentisate geranylgeranyltransferase